MIKKKEKESFIGQTVGSMKEIGLMGNNMALVFTHNPLGSLSKGNGKRVKELLGSDC
jgi:hypothetical protein